MMLFFFFHERRKMGMHHLERYITSENPRSKEERHLINAKSLFQL